MGDTRSVNPGDLEELARRLDGEYGDGGVNGELNAIFTRAANLGVSGELSRLRPMQTWLSETSPDLRRRAGLARLEGGDPTAGLQLAGFSPDEIENFEGELPPDRLLLVNSLAANGHEEDDVFARQPREELEEYLARVGAHYIGRLTGLEAHEETIANLAILGYDVFQVASAAGVVLVQGTQWLNVVAVNPALRGAFARYAPAWLRSVWAGPPTRFLSAPGTWLPGQLANLLRGHSTRLDRLLGIPGTAGVRGDVIGRGYNWLRNTPLMNAPLWRGVSANNVINFLVGNDRLAAGLHMRGLQGPAIARAAQASMVRVGSNAYSMLRALGSGRVASSIGSLTTTFRATGALRFMGVAGGVAATGISVYNVAVQGWPWERWQELNTTSEKAGYLADWAEVGFNASLTAAMVAPNPWTVGAAVVTGVIYGGLKIVEHWDDITEWAGNAWDATTEFVGDAWDATTEAVSDAWDATTEAVGDAVDTVTDVAGDIVDGVGDFVGSLF